MSLEQTIREILENDTHWNGNIINIIITDVKGEWVYADISYTDDDGKTSSYPLGINIESKRVINCTIDDD